MEFSIYVPPSISQLPSWPGLHFNKILALDKLSIHFPLGYHRDNKTYLKGTW